MAATAAAAAAAASKWRNGVFALLPPLPPSRPPTLWLARSWMAIYLCLRTLCARAGESEGGREGGRGAPAPEDNSNFHLSNCKT